MHEGPLLVLAGAGAARPGPHPPDRLPDRRLRVPPRASWPSPYQQGGGRDARAGGEAPRPRRPRALGLDLPLDLRAGSAPGRRPPRPLARFRDLRRRRRSGGGPRGAAPAFPRPEDPRATPVVWRIDQWKNHGWLRTRLRGAATATARSRRRSTPATTPAARGHALDFGDLCSSPPTSRALPGGLRHYRGVGSTCCGRVPGNETRPVPARDAARRRTPEPLRGRRS